MTGAQVGFGFGSRAPAAPDSVRLLLGDVCEAIDLVELLEPEEEEVEPVVPVGALDYAGRP